MKATAKRTQPTALDCFQEQERRRREREGPVVGPTLHPRGRDRREKDKTAPFHTYAVAAAGLFPSEGDIVKVVLIIRKRAGKKKKKA